MMRIQDNKKSQLSKIPRDLLDKLDFNCITIHPTFRDRWSKKFFYLAAHLLKVLHFCRIPLEILRVVLKSKATKELGEKWDPVLLLQKPNGRPLSKRYLATLMTGTRLVDASIFRSTPFFIILPSLYFWKWGLISCLDEKPLNFNNMP